MSDDEKKELEDAGENLEGTSGPAKPEEDLGGSDAFDALASGTDQPSTDPSQEQPAPASDTSASMDAQPDVMTPPPPPQSPEEPQNQPQASQQTPDNKGEAEPESPEPSQETGTNFADSFEDNYESEFADYDDFYEDDSLGDNDFDDEFEEFDDSDSEDEFSDNDFDDAIDAEFSEFDGDGPDDDFDGTDDDWSTDSDDDGSGDTPPKGGGGSGKSGGGMPLNFSSPLVKYGAIGAAVVVLGGGAFMFMGGSDAPQSNFRAPSQEQASNSIPSQRDSSGSNRQQASGQNANSGQQSGQSLSSIINSGQISEDGGNQSGGLLDNLDNIETQVEQKPQQAQSQTVPVFKERQSLDSLASGMPSPTPITNSDDTAEMETISRNNVRPGQRAQMPRDNAMDVRSIPVEDVQGQQLSASQRRTQNNAQNTDMANQQRQVMPSPFNSDTAQNQAQEPVEADLQNIQRQAEAKAQEQQNTQSEQNNQAEQNRQAARQNRQNALEQSLSDAGNFMRSIGTNNNEQTVNDQQARNMPRPMDSVAQNLEENVTKFEEQTSTFITRIQEVEQKIDQFPDPAIVRSLEDKIDFLTSKLGRLEQQVKESEKRTASNSASSQRSTSRASQSAQPTQPAPQRATRKPTPSITWELRAASPGQAWVSQTGQKELKQIGIGDKLAGVGTIQSITNQGGRWIVTGSSGKITQ